LDACGDNPVNAIKGLADAAARYREHRVVLEAVDLEV
jgi:hypothetical protein